MMYGYCLHSGLTVEQTLPDWVMGEYLRHCQSVGRCLNAVFISLPGVKAL